MHSLPAMPSAGFRAFWLKPLAQALAQGVSAQESATDSDSVLLEGVGVSSQLKLADLIGREL